MNKSKEKSIPENNTPSISKKYKKKIIHIVNVCKNNMLKNKTQFPSNNDNTLTNVKKNSKINRNYLSPKNINITTSKKSNLKGRTDLRSIKNYIINYEHNSAIKFSIGKIKNMKLFNENKFINKNTNYLMNSPKYSKTIINNCQSSKSRKYVKKFKYKSKEIENNNNDKKMIYIYKTKLLKIFVKLMEDFYKKQIKRIFNIFIYKLKDKIYFFNTNKTINKKKKIYKKISENRIYDYKTRINYQDIINENNLEKYIIPNKDFQSMTMYHMNFNKKEENNNNNKKIYIPIHNRFENSNKIREKYFIKNIHSNPKYKIFDNMKIEKNPKKIEQNNGINKNQNINTQINNYYNTKNTNFYFNKINSFNSLVIEKQRPRYYCPKNNIKQKSIEKTNNLSLNGKKKINLNTPKTNMKNVFTSIENRSKKLIYRKILSKENKKKINEDNADSLVNRTEKIFDKKNNYKKYDNILTKDEDYLINYYTSIAHNIKESYNNNGDLSNDFHNYCLEDIDKPMNIIYSKNENEDDENFEKDQVKNLKQIKSGDRRLFMNFNYIKYNENMKEKDLINKNNNNLRNNILFISGINSIFILNKSESSLEKHEIKINIFLKIKIIINSIIYKYKSNFFERIKEIKFKSLFDAISEKNKKNILKKYFDVYKKNITIKDNDNKGIKSNNLNNFNNFNNKSQGKIKENIENKDEYKKKFESFRINLLKYIFCRKSM